MKIHELINLINESQATPNNVDGSFVVGKVKFDNHKGVGATPNNANILYRGAVAWIKPSTFRELAAGTDEDRSKSATDIEKMILDGKAIGTPFLQLDIEGDDPTNPTSVRVVGHEGRARADAFKKLNGNVPMPVQLDLMSYRARNINEDFFKWIEANGLIKEKSRIINIKPRAEKYFWNEKTIDPAALKEGMMKRSDPQISGETTKPKIVSPKSKSNHSQRMELLAKQSRKPVSDVETIWHQERDKVDQNHPNRWEIIMTSVKRRLGITN